MTYILMIKIKKSTVFLKFTAEKSGKFLDGGFGL
jgi:hypothetical protein